MCGIVGIRRFDGRPVDVALLARMAAQVQHRGPDGEGFACFSGGAVGFGHRRLSIIDLAGSPQPMRSANGPCHITFNGEIFNYRQLRRDLAARGVTLQTNGDTETVLELCRLEGVQGLGRLNGQFAFAFHDEASGALWLGRDRLGILPLYYCEGPGFFAFASEVKALLPAIGAPQLDDEAV